MIAGATAAAIQELPQYLIQGLMSGTYSAKGGVIMDAAGKVLGHVAASTRGVEWLDDLRRDLSDRTMILAGRRVDQRSVEYVKSLPARNDVLNGYSAHFGYLADQKLSATEFATTINGYLEQSQVEA
jgi:hypothetical protein